MRDPAGPNHDSGGGTARRECRKVKRETRTDTRRGKEGTHPLCQDTGDLLSHAALASLDLLPDSGEAASLTQLHDELDLTVRCGHVRAVEAHDVHVPQASEERELTRELLQRALMRDDRLARQ